MAVVSGTVSHITGGKFANGAVTGAFVHLFNSEDFASFQNYIKNSYPVGYASDGSLKDLRGYYNSHSKYGISDVVNALDTVANYGDGLQIAGTLNRNILMVEVGTGISVVATTFKIIVDPKPYKTYEVVNEYINPIFTVTPAY